MINPSGLCECGCGKQTSPATQTRSDRGYKKGEPVRFCPGHGRRKHVEYRVEDCGHSTPCWLWLKNLNNRGYGISWSGTQRGAIAHRLYFERAYGAIPSGHDIHHLCGQKSCVNPDHLQAVTPSEHGRLHYYASGVGL